MNKYAIIFEIERWDDFTHRQFLRLKENVAQGDIFIAFNSDEISPRLPTYLNEFSFSKKKLKENDLELLGGFHSNVDYLPILFYIEKEKYDYYVTINYRVSVFNNIDKIISSLMNDDVDILSTEINGPVSRWPHLAGCIDFYNFRQISPKLFFISFLSKLALSSIYSRRISQKKIKKIKKSPFFPSGEAVIGSESNISYLKEKKLSDYCDDLSNYNWNQGIPEKSLGLFPHENTFLYPVGDDNFVVQSNLTSDISRVNEKMILKAKELKDPYFFSRILFLEKNSEEDSNLIIEAMKEVFLDRKFYFLSSNLISTGFSERQSSISEYTTSSCCYNTIGVFPKFSFSMHTNEENNPFWECIFDKETYIKYIYIYDRPDLRREYKYSIKIEKIDGFWEDIYTSSKEEYLGNAFTEGKYLEINKEVVKINISILGIGMLHLDTVVISSR